MSLQDSPIVQPGGVGGGLPAENAQMKTGTYTGDGADDRDINTGINLAAKTYAYVIIKGNTTQVAVHRIEYGQGDLTMYYDSTTDAANLLQQFTATGFEVGSNNIVNASGVTFRYIAFWVD